MYYSLDRFDNAYAVLVCDDGTQMRVLAADLPEDAAEGDLLMLADGAWVVDYEQTRERKERLRERLKRLFGE